MVLGFEGKKYRTDWYDFRVPL